MDGKLNLIAIDPGEEHNGVAIFVAGACRFTASVDRRTLFASIGMWTGNFCRDTGKFDVMVVEEFKLYPSKAASLSWSTLGTVEIIGALREGALRNELLFVTQPASIKKATRALVQRRGLVLLGSDGHARDAELHGYYYLLADERARAK
jgi:hypothetical protein